MSNHTAIVHEVLGPATVTILHQNYGADGKKVSSLTLNLLDLKEGTLQMFRPSAGPWNSRTE